MEIFPDPFCPLSDVLFSAPGAGNAPYGRTGRPLPLETLASVYVGLELFGFFGFLLGPLGLLLIEDLVKEWEESY